MDAGLGQDAGCDRQSQFVCAGPAVNVVPLADFGTPSIMFGEPANSIIERHGSVLPDHGIGKTQVEFKILPVRVTAV